MNKEIIQAIQAAFSEAENSNLKVLKRSKFTSSLVNEGEETMTEANFRLADDQLCSIAWGWVGLETYHNISFDDGHAVDFSFPDQWKSAGWKGAMPLKSNKIRIKAIIWETSNGSEEREPVNTM